MRKIDGKIPKMEVELTDRDKVDLITAINLLIEKENDSVCYKELTDKLGITDFQY